MDICNLSNEEFKDLLQKMLKELGRRKDGHSETFNKVENIKKIQTKLKNNWNFKKYTRKISTAD